MLNEKNIVKSTLKKSDRPVTIGIDEAGRGPVMGYLAYCAMVFYEDTLVDKGFKDSKKLSQRQRVLMETYMKKNNFEYVCKLTHPTTISHAMITGEQNLNQISMNAVIELLTAVNEHYSNVKTVFIDALGNSETYKKLLKTRFDYEYVIEQKADSLYPIVSAASIMAKVTRDQALKEFGEGFGSGYPSDPYTRKWLKENFNKVFGFPEGVRHSWKTISSMLEDKKPKEFLGQLRGFYYSP